MKDFRTLRIAFMGTPAFAVASLEALVKAGCNVVGVVTAPDRPAGRGMKLTESAVKQYAVQQGIPILQPEKLKDPEFIAQLQQWKADLQVVVAFRMLPQIVWEMPPMGTVNLHGSLLPHYRGAAPINWAIINGEKETGVTTFRLKHEIDTGNILMQEKIAIGEDMTAGELHDTMKAIGAQLLVKTVEGLGAGTLVEQPQEDQADGGELKHAPKIHTDTCRINWSLPVEQVHNHIRGLSPTPGAFTVINEKMLKVYKAKKEVVVPTHSEGEHDTDGKSYLKFACANGYIHLLEVQLEGKKRIGISEFIRGFRAGENS